MTPSIAQPDVAGADGCRAGWVLVTWRVGAAARLDVEVVSTGDLVARAKTVAALGIDIPIGLLRGGGARTCDTEARRALGPNRASVFPAPDRTWLEAARVPGPDAYARAREQARRHTGRSISVQAFNIAPKVLAIDDALRATPGLQAVVHEVHPELAFQAMHGEPLGDSKKSAVGRALRWFLLTRAFAPLGLAAELARLRQTPRPSGCLEDDVLDACAAAWTARRIVSGTALSLPAAALVDEYGIRMQIRA